MKKSLTVILCFFVALATILYMIISPRVTVSTLNSLHFFARVVVGIALTTVFLLFLAHSWKDFSRFGLISVSLTAASIFCATEAVLSLVSNHHPGIFLPLYLLFRSLSIHLSLTHKEGVKVVSRKKRAVPELVRKVG